MKLKAVVPHDVNFYHRSDCTSATQRGRDVLVVGDGAKPYLTVPREQDPLRLVPDGGHYAEELAELDVPVSAWLPSKLNFQPASETGVGYIVSLAVVSYLPHYPGMFFVVDRPVVDTAGKIVGCIGLSQVVF